MIFMSQGLKDFTFLSVLPFVMTPDKARASPIKDFG
jgi:hypothetical protein